MIRYIILTILYLIVVFHLVSCRTNIYNPDTDPEVLDWYIDNNDTIIYKKQDSIMDARKRWEYHRSLAHDSLWE